MPSTHVRKQIRDALVTALTGLTTTTTHVYDARLHALATSNLPCLLINTDQEEIEPADMNAGGILSRSLTVLVRGVAKTTTTIDDTLDEIARQVEVALAGSTLSSLVHRLDLVNINIEFDDQAEKPVGVISLQYLAHYFTTAAAPQTAL